MWGDRGGGDENWQEEQEGEICCIDANQCLEERRGVSRSGVGDDAPEGRSTPASFCGLGDGLEKRSICDSVTARLYPPIPLPQGSGERIENLMLEGSRCCWKLDKRKPSRC